MTESEMAARLGVSRPTLRRLEAGSLSVGLALLVRALEVLGMDSQLDLIAADDDLGLRISDAALKRPRRRSSQNSADAL
jgi:transcriptional regulator with XRE-family HTH domain